MHHGRCNVDYNMLRLTTIYDVADNKSIIWICQNLLFRSIGHISHFIDDLFSHLAYLNGAAVVIGKAMRVQLTKYSKTATKTQNSQETKT